MLLITLLKSALRNPLERAGSKKLHMRHKTTTWSEAVLRQGSSNTPTIEDGPRLAGKRDHPHGFAQNATIQTLPISLSALDVTTTAHAIGMILPLADLGRAGAIQKTNITNNNDQGNVWCAPFFRGMWVGGFGFSSYSNILNGLKRFVRTPHKKGERTGCKLKKISQSFIRG